MEARSINNSSDDQLFKIVAEDRMSKKRVTICPDLSKAEAIAYRPAPRDKKYYKYFRVVKCNP